MRFIPIWGLVAVLLCAGAAQDGKEEYRSTDTRQLYGNWIGAICLDSPDDPDIFVKTTITPGASGFATLKVTRVLFKREYSPSPRDSSYRARVQVDQQTRRAQLEFNENSRRMFIAPDGEQGIWKVLTVTSLYNTSPNDLAGYFDAGVGEAGLPVVLTRDRGTSLAGFAKSHRESICYRTRVDTYPD